MYPVKPRSILISIIKHGLSSSTLANALTHSWPKGELLIAQEIGVTPAEI
ncbi:helix-turn-helix domain-containing protein [Photorhabdus noenieputensis]|nr:helix-turn-helix domain-containing protein [Photorhabdus noenieputensis]